LNPPNNYKWSYNNGFDYVEKSKNSDSNPLVKFTSTGTYKVELEVNNECKIPNKSSRIFKVIDAKAPVVTAPPDNCLPFNYIIPDKGDGAKYFLNDIEVMAGVTIQIDTSDISYQLRAELTNECGTLLDAKEFLVSPKKGVNIFPATDTEICQGSDIIKLTVNRTDGKWEPNPNFNFIGNEAYFNPLSTGTYKVKYIRGSGACSTWDEKPIVVKGVKIDINDISLCSGSSNFLLNAIPSGGEWSIKSPQCTDCLKGDSLIVSQLNKGSLTLNYFFKDTISGCDNNKNVDVSIGNPIADFSLSGGCGGEPLVVDNKSTGATSYQWYVNSKDEGKSFEPSFNLSGGKYKIELIVESGKCSNPKTEIISITDPPEDVHILSDKLEQCTPMTVSLVPDKGIRDDLTYRWIINESDTIDSYELSDVVFENNEISEIEKRIILKSFNQCGTSFDEVKLIVKPNVYADLAVDSTYIRCSPANFLFSNRSVGTNGISSWKIGDSPFFETSLDTLSRQFVTEKDIEDYEIILKVENSCGTSQDTVKVTVEPLKIIPLISIDKSIVCLGEPILFTDASTPAAQTFIWNFGDGEYAGKNNISHEYKFSDTTFNVVYTAKTKCASGKDSVIIKINKLPQGDFELAKNECTKNLVEIINKSVIDDNNIISKFIWDFGDGSPFDSSYSASHIYLSEGLKRVNMEIIGPNNYCSNQITKNIYIHEGPIPDFQILTDSLCLGSEIKVENLSKFSNSFFWEFNNDNRLEEFEPRFRPSNAGSYTVKLVADIDDLCADSIEVFNSFHILSCIVNVPEVFTPDEIEPGEYWNLIGQGITSIKKIEIKNRWGKTVFFRENTTPNYLDDINGWNGKYRSELQPTGVYIVTYEVQMFDNSISRGSKPIYLLR
jgi:PKD repeat protein